MKFSIILLLSLSALQYVKADDIGESVEKSAIRSIFDEQIQITNTTLETKILNECNQLELSEAIRNNITTATISFDTCYQILIEDIVRKYEVNTTQFDRSSILDSDAYPLFMCEYYKSAYKCAWGLVRNLAHCSLTRSFSSKYNLMYGGARIGVDVLCDYNGEILKMLIRKREELKCYGDIFNREDFKRLFTSSELFLFQREESCFSLLDFILNIENLSTRSCTDDMTRVMKLVTFKLWKDSGCRKYDRLNSRFMQEHF